MIILGREELVEMYSEDWNSRKVVKDIFEGATGEI